MQSSDVYVCKKCAISVPCYAIIQGSKNPCRANCLTGCGGAPEWERLIIKEAEKQTTTPPAQNYCGSCGHKL
jgi:hypothetical protein